MFNNFSKGFMMNRKEIEFAIEQGAYYTTTSETCIVVNEIAYTLTGGNNIDKLKPYIDEKIENFNDDCRLVYETAKLYLTDIMTPEFVDKLIAIDNMNDILLNISEGDMNDIVKEYTEKAKTKMGKEEKEKKIQEAKNQIKALASLIAELES